MQVSQETKESLLYLVEEMSQETKKAEQAGLATVKKHVTRLGKLQLRFNAEIAKVFCYG